MESARTAVLLDRQPLWLEAVERVLQRIDVRVAGKATSPEPALQLIEAHRPNVCVTGIEMGEGHMDGITCISEARERISGLRAVVLSSHTSTEYIDKALDAGAGGETPDQTRREQEILRLVAEGHSNAKLAKMLWVTEQTVKFHLSNVYRKLGVSNRTEAARWAQVNELLPAAPQEMLNERRMQLVAG